MTLPEVARTASVTPLDRQLAAERTMFRAIIRGVVFATPVCVVVLVGMMALALHGKQPWYVWTGLGVAMGVYVGGFFGMVAGVMGSSHLLDITDEEAAHQPLGFTSDDRLAHHGEHSGDRDTEEKQQSAEPSAPDAPPGTRSRFVPWPLRSLTGESRTGDMGQSQSRTTASDWAQRTGRSAVTALASCRSSQSGRLRLGRNCL